MYFIYLSIFVLYLTNGSRLNVGGQQDDHGCLASAGYVWCESVGTCVRPFELETEHPCSTENLSAARTDPRRRRANVGGQQDDHGCLSSAGYVWCASEESCVRPFEMETEHPCSTENLSAARSHSRRESVGAPQDGQQCLASAGYVWCESEGACVRPFEQESEHPCSTESLSAAQSDPERESVGGQEDDNGCLASAGYVWCESEASCVRPFEMETEHPCSTASLSAAQTEVPRRRRRTVGGQQDTHGCLAAAGYVWCASEAKCVRPFEMESDHPCSTESLSAAQTNAPRSRVSVGGKQDDHGCLASAGYVWCDSENTCVRPFEMETEHPCSTESLSAAGTNSQVNVGGEEDANGCLASAGYVWCDSENKCVRPFELEDDHPCSTQSLSARETN